MAREPIELTKKKAEARAKAVGTILARHRTELNDEIRAEMAKIGIDWTPRPDAAARKANAAATKKNRAVKRAAKILKDAGVDVVVSIDPAGDRTAVGIIPEGAPQPLPSPGAVRDTVREGFERWKGADDYDARRVALGAGAVAGMGQATAAAADAERVVVEMSENDRRALAAVGSREEWEAHKRARQELAETVEQNGDGLPPMNDTPVGESGVAPGPQS